MIGDTKGNVSSLSSSFSDSYRVDLLRTGLKGEIVNHCSSARRQSGNGQWNAAEPRGLLQRQDQRSDAEYDAEDGENQHRSENKIASFDDQQRHDGDGASTRHQTGNR